MTPPSPLAEFLPAGPGGPAAEAAGLRSLLGEAALPRTADFAALLQQAGLAAPPLAAANLQRSPEEPAADRGGDEPASSSVVDGILFLAVVQTTGAPDAPAPAVATTARAAAESRRPVDLAVVDKQLRPETKLGSTPASSPNADDAASVVGDAVPVASDSSQTSSTFEEALSASQARRDAAIPAERAPRAALDLSSSAPSAQPTPQRSIQGATGADTDLRTTSSRAVESTAPLSSSQNASAPALTTTTIETPVHDPSWRFEAATRIASLMTRGIEHAELRVTPPDLGPVELRIDVRGGEATLAIVATQPATRDALELALPMLRDMLAQQGLSLGQATVADGRGESQSNGEASRVRTDASGSDGMADDAGAARAAHRGIARGLIDVFA